MKALRFILGALALHLLFSWLYLTTVVPDHEAVQRDTWFLERGDDIHILVVGDSHPRMDVIGRNVPGMLNIATRGEDYVKNRYRLAWLLDQRADHIDTVLLGFDAGSFSSTRLEAFRPEFVWGRYVPFFDLGFERGRPRAYMGKWVKAKVAPYAGELETLSQYIGQRSSFRSRADRSVEIVRMQWGPVAAKRHFPPGTAWHPALVDALQGMLADLKARNIRVFLVSYPVTADYAIAADKLGADDARRAALLQTLLEPGVVDHLDYSALGYGQRKFFGDADHLSPGGAKAFTIRLRKDLTELGIVRGATP